MKAEIRALEQAVCGLVTKLDLLLRAEWGVPLLDAGHGLHISTPDHLGEGCDAFVTIRPTGWPEKSFIHAHFYHGAGGWKFWGSGVISADHLPNPINSITFELSDGVLGLCFGYQKQFVVQGYEQLIEALKKDVANYRK